MMAVQCYLDYPIPCYPNTSLIGMHGYSDLQSLCGFVIPEFDYINLADQGVLGRQPHTVSLFPVLLLLL